MSDSNTPVDIQIDDDLDAFTADFFGQNDAQETPASVTGDEEDNTEVDALEPTVTNDDDAVETEDEVDAETAPVVEKPKTPTQKRIDEVVGKQREAERQLATEKSAREALEARVAELLAQNVKAAPVGEAEDIGPMPSDVNPDGSDKYALGEFDPEYIRDLIKYENNRDRAEYEAQSRQRADLADMAAQKAAIEDNWKEKIGPAKERYPDFDEVSQHLVASFEGLDQAYGEYLVATLQSMDFGPDVLYYLAQNPDEANKIVASGPNKATIALGRIEAKYAIAEAEKVVAKPRVSNAPPVPPQNKGTHAAVTEVPDDTDDLEAFTAKLFKKRK